MSKKKIVLFLSLILIAILSITACGGPSQKTGGTKESKIVIAQGSDALFLDPHGNDEGPTNSVNCNIYDGLINRNADLSLVAGLAERWEQKDPVTWVFYLRKNVKFHNGNVFRADDVEFTINRVKQNKVTADLVSSVDTVKKLDDYTVEIKTKTPYASFLAAMAKVWIVNKEYVAKVGDQEFNLKPVGTGPYKFVEWVKEDHITLQANDSYWNGAPEIKTVIFRPISNEATRTAALLSGDVHLIVDVPVRDADRVAKHEKLQFVGVPSLRLIYLHVDVTRDKTPTVDQSANPLKDDRVKKAIRMGIDTDAIIKSIMNGHAYPALQGNPKQVLGYFEGIQGVKYDPEQAKKLLAEAGYPNGFSITLDAPNNRYPNDFKVAEAVAAQLSKIGVNVKLNLMPKSIFFNYVRPGDKTSLCLAGWSSDSGDGGNWYELMFYSRDKKPGHGGSNRTHYSSPAFDALIDKAGATANLAERTKYLQEATKLMDKDMPFIPLYFQEDSYGVTKDFDFKPRLDNYIYVKDIRFKK